jgi:hypothetical protein
MDDDERRIGFWIRGGHFLGEGVQGTRERITVGGRLYSMVQVCLGRYASGLADECASIQLVLRHLLTISNKV